MKLNPEPLQMSICASTKRTLLLEARGGKTGILDARMHLRIFSLLEPVDLMTYCKLLAATYLFTTIKYDLCLYVQPNTNSQKFSWAPFPHFPSFYAPREYIYEYLQEVADQFNLRKYIQVSHKITKAEWNEKRSKWLVTIVRTDGRDLVVSDSQDKEGELDDSFVEECDVQQFQIDFLFKAP